MDKGSRPFREGLVIGRFDPPHHGHKYLIETALAACDHVVVFVCDGGQKLNAGLRAEWLAEIHPAADVRVIADTVPDDDSEGWAAYTIATLGYRPDAVFTSEDYGQAYAKFMACEHVQVDKARVHVPMSATRVRSDAYACWDYLEPCVRAWFVCRVCLVGAESTGKTTLAQSLARHFETVWTPEFGRYYWQGRGGLGQQPDWRPEEFAFIAGMQSKWEDGMARLANRILISDTNSFATQLWHERYLGAMPAAYPGQQPDLYLLTAPDFPFVQDGYRDGEHIREAMHGRFAAELARQDVPWTLLNGSAGERLTRAIALCRDALERKKAILG